MVQGSLQSGTWLIRNALRIFLTTVLLAIPVSAQFSGLSTTGDGSVVYFSTPFRQTGTDQPLWPKLFAADEQGIRLFLQREITSWTTNQNLTRTSNPFLLFDPQVSDDGSILAFSSQPTCSGGGSPCLYRALPHSEVLAGVESTDFGIGSGSLSRNGRFLLRVGTSIEPTENFLHDLRSGNKVQLPYPTARGRNLVTNDGAALVALQGRQLVLWRASAPDDPKFIASIGWYTVGQVNADGSTVVLREYTPPDQPQSWNLDAIDVASGRRTRLAAGQPASQEPLDYGAVGISLSSDGRVVLFTAPVDGAKQLFLANTDGSRVRALPQAPSGIVDAVLSGNGRVAYASTAENGLLRIDIESGDVRYLVERTAVYGLGPINRGSYMRFTGRGFLPLGRSTVATPPLPRSLAGLQVVIGGEPAPLVSVTPTEIAFQVPWDVNLEKLEFKQEAAIFEQRGAIENICCERPFPQFLIPTAVHEAFDSSVTSERPARSGEVVHFYMTGLGDVSPAVATGEASPANPPAKVLEQLSFFVNGALADVLFAGLAPGLVGVYQVDVRLPGNLPLGEPPIIMRMTEREAFTQMPTRP